jgi:acetoacetyl-CoA synthetase
MPFRHQKYRSYEEEACVVGLSENTGAGALLWTPSQERIENTNLVDFMVLMEDRTGKDITNYAELHAFSVADRASFWLGVWDYCGVVGEKIGPILGGKGMPGERFFPESRLNFAENLLKPSSGMGSNDSGASDSDAIIYRGENGEELGYTRSQLSALVSRIQQWLTLRGVGVGDRVAAMMPNRPETAAAMLAVTGLGAVWSSCSPDFGVQGVLDRFGQIKPKVLIACDGYHYAGKRLDGGDKLVEIAQKLEGLSAVLVVPCLEDGHAASVAARIANAVALPDAIKPFAPAPITFERLPFDHPVYILYSSGTTGVPKCIVHGAGGTLLQHLKEHQLQCDIKPGDRVFYFTTCGWMMWNWLISALASDATLLLFDGSPFHPNPDVLWDYAAAEKATFFGTSAKYIDACRKADLAPVATHDLSSMRMLASTGSPLAPEGFDYIYTKVKQDVHLASISGGTDIVSCFVGGDPTAPVRRSEIQAAGLGMAVEVWNEDGKPVKAEKGELVCVHSFPSMPIHFWNDPGNVKYRAAYFERFANIWCHGDFAEITEHGGFIIHGRSDATLNPGGVRIGTAEIYAQVERIPAVIEALAIGQDWEGDVRVVLFVRLAAGIVLDDVLEKQIRNVIRTGATPRHVPARVIAVADIPRTKSGKITELAVRDVVHGRVVKNKEALANPEALDLFVDLEQLKS